MTRLLTPCKSLAIGLLLHSKLKASAAASTYSYSRRQYYLFATVCKGIGIKRPKCAGHVLIG